MALKRLRIALTEAEGRKVNQFCCLIRTNPTECVAFIDSLVNKYGKPNVRGNLKNIGREVRYLDIEEDICEAEYVKLFSMFLRLTQCNICQRFLDDCKEKGWCTPEHLVKEAPLVNTFVRKQRPIKQIKIPVISNSLTQKKETEEKIINDVFEEVKESAPIVDNEKVTELPLVTEETKTITVNQNDFMQVIEWACHQEGAPHQVLCKLLANIVFKKEAK